MNYFTVLPILSLFLLIPATHQACTPEFTAQYLARHNEYRALHGVPPLVLNETISTYAQEWSDHLLMAGGKDHRNQYTYGENLFVCWDPSATPMGANSPVDWYYNEIRHYYNASANFTQEPDLANNEVVTHFTQVVWKGSSQMGVGCTIGSTKKYTVVVSNYYPKGNILTRFMNNVPPPSNFTATASIASSENDDDYEDADNEIE